MKIVADEDEQSCSKGADVRHIGPKVVINSDKNEEDRHLKALEVQSLCLVVKQAVDE